MEHGQLLPPVWNVNHSYPQYEISTPNLGMEYGPLPTPVRKYRSLLIASIEYGPCTPNPSTEYALLLTPTQTTHNTSRGGRPKTEKCFTN